MNKTMILVVEYDYAVRNLITTALKTQNYIFHTAENGNQALLEAVSQNPDAIFGFGIAGYGRNRNLSKEYAHGQISRLSLSVQGQRIVISEALMGLMII